jgi:hypothetical protein
MRRTTSGLCKQETIFMRYPGRRPILAGYPRVLS